MPNSCLAVLIAVFLGLSTWVALPAAAQPVPSQGPVAAPGPVTTPVSPAPHAADPADHQRALFTFALEYMTVSVIGGLAGYWLMSFFETGWEPVLTGGVGGSTLASLAYLLSIGSIYQNRSNYR